MVLLSVAVDYYRSVDAPSLLGKALYYKGCFYKENNDLIQAVACFKQAEVLNLQEVANGYLRLDKPDSAGFYFNQITPYLSECEELKYASIFHNIGLYNENHGDLNLAEKFILKSLDIKKNAGNRTVSDYALARIYRRQGKVDASDSLWNVVLNEVKDIRMQRGIYQTLFEQNFAEEKYKDAAFYAEKQAACNDSIYRTSMAKEIADVQAKYDNEVLLRKNAERIGA